MLAANLQERLHVDLAYVYSSKDLILRVRHLRSRASYTSRNLLIYGYTSYAYGMYLRGLKDDSIGVTVSGWADICYRLRDHICKYSVSMNPPCITLAYHTIYSHLLGFVYTYARIPTRLDDDWRFLEITDLVVLVSLKVSSLYFNILTCMAIPCE